MFFPELLFYSKRLGRGAPREEGGGVVVMTTGKPSGRRARLRRTTKRAPQMLIDLMVGSQSCFGRRSKQYAPHALRPRTALQREQHKAFSFLSLIQPSIHPSERQLFVIVILLLTAVCVSGNIFFYSVFLLKTRERRRRGIDPGQQLCALQ